MVKILPPRKSVGCADGSFPGQATIEERKDKCGLELAAYAPAATNDPSVRVLTRYPDEKTWELGDRSVTCIAALGPLQTGVDQGLRRLARLFIPEKPPTLPNWPVR